MLSPKQIIEKIKKIRFGIGLNTNNVSEDVLAHMADGKKFKDNASRLASDLHTEKPHFILELIQNAEDNNYGKNITPTVKFIYQRDKLILQNNELGFNKKNVWALCGIGQTTKQDKKAGYIGEKGIGFKSVFMVTSEPCIYSNGFQFKFIYDEKDPISIIIPHWVNDIPHFVDSDKTNIILPLKNEVKDQLIKFMEIDPCLLLFLRKLRYIKIEDKSQNKSVEIERHDSEGMVKIKHLEGEDNWRIVKSPEPLKVPLHIKEEKRKDITETEIVFAFPLTADGSAETSTEQKVFVYLPVRSYGFKFIIQADFLMPPSREDIHKDESDKSWNKWLRNNIASIFLKAVEEFKLDEKLKKTYYNYIPLTNEVTDTFFSPVVEQIQNNLRETQCILTESKIWLKPIEIFRGDNEIRALIQNDDLKRFFDKEYISSDIKVNEQILDALGVPKFGFNHLVQCLQKEEWLEKQSDEWFTRLYAYLNDQKLKEEQIQALKNLKIVRLENNKLVSISEKNIFFPLDKKGEYGFEKEVRVVKKELLEIKKKEVKESIIEFLKSLGVCDARPCEIIENHILPIYESDDENKNWKSKGNKTLLGYIRYIKENLQNYEKESDKRLNANKGFREQKEEPLKRLRDSLFIRINKTINGTNYYDHPENIYLPKTYGNNNNLETLFEGIEDISFVHRGYINDIIKKYRKSKRMGEKGKANIRKKREVAVKEWRDFFIRIRVNDGLKVIIERDTYLDGGEKSKLRNGRNWSSEKVTDYSLKQLKAILDELVKDTSEKKKKKSKLLLTLLERQWMELSKYTKLKYEWGWYGGTTSASADSSWLHLLKTTSWLPTNKGTFAKPSVVFLDKSEIRKLLGDSVPYLTIEVKNEELIKVLEINLEANIEGAINNLKSLEEQKSQDMSLFTKLYNFLNKKYEGNEDTIKTAFSENPIIYLPHTTKSYFISRDVLWKNVSDVFGENRGYLEKHYPKLKSFFVEKVGVNEKPTPKDYANVLIDLSEKEIVNKNDEKTILKIYSELNYHLNPENNEHMISEEEWWQDFVSKPIFWTKKNEFWKNDNDVYVNDDEELYRLFNDKAQLAFLKLPKHYYPKLNHFITAADIAYLSKAVKTELYDITGIIELNILTKQIQEFSSYILRYFYQLEHDKYKKFNKDGTLVQLKNLRCFGIEKLLIKYTLNEQTACAQRNAILSNGNLYIQNDHLEDTDHLAMELSKLFGDMKGFDDFLILLFDKKTDEKIENYLNAKGIQELPWGEKEKEDREMIVEEKLPIHHIPEVPPTSTPSGIPERSESIVEQERIEKKGWRPEYTPSEVEIHFEEPQVLEKTEPEIQEREKSHGKLQTPLRIPKETERDALSQKAKMAIGKWGEEYALKCLKKNLSDKYPKGKVKETSDGFYIRLDDLLIVEIHWLNAIDDRGVGHDIKLIENKVEKYIEVKSTKTDTKDWFELSDKQWKLMKQEGDKFHIYRVYNAGTKEVKLIDISNPYKMWEEGGLTAYPIRIQI